MKHLLRSLALAAILFTSLLHAQVPQLLNYQGRVAVGNPAVNFDGSGQFRFALVNAAGNTTYWSNDGTSVGGSQPTAAVALTVSKGLYSVLLGDTAVAGMPTAIHIRPNSGSSAQPAFIRVDMTGSGDGSPNAILLGADGPNFSGTGFIDTTQAGVAAATPLSFRIGGNEKVRISPNGNVGIGTTAPQERLHVGGNLTLDGDYLRSAGRLHLQSGERLYLNPFAGDTYVGFGGGPGNLSVAGNVGIGTTAPDRPLSIHKAGGNGDWISFKDSNDATIWHLNNVASGLNFAQSGVAEARLFLANNGNVGIGTLTPAAKLDVVGDIKATTGTFSSSISASSATIPTLNGNVSLGGTVTTTMALVVPARYEAETIITASSSGTRRTRWSCANTGT